jgi:predicted phage terminase large subunit-like protein
VSATFDPQEILKQFNPEQLNQLRIDALREAATKSLHHFIRQGWKYMDPAEFVDNWHIGAICEHLEAVTRGQIRRLIINQPPRTQKSLTTAVAWPAWAWAQGETSPLAGPSTSYMFASYAQNLSVRDSVKCRRLIESPWYQSQWGKNFTLTSDQNTKMRFDNSAGGYRIATSVGGYLTGEGASVICVDDPHNTVEAESELVSQGVLDWWDEAMSTRLNDPKTGAYVLVMQRLQENDLCGHILERDTGWVHLMLPMRFDDRRVCVTVLGFQDPREEDGELLWPERFGEPEVDELETRLGPYAAAGQLQQSPTPRGGGIIKREWWRPWPPIGEEERWTKTVAVTGLDGVTSDVERITYPDFELILVSVDTAYTEKEENDYSAVTIWGIFRYRSVPKIMLIHAWRDRLELHPLVARLLDTCKKRGADMVLVEGKASGISVAQEIKRLMRPGQFTVRVEDPKRQDKTARLTAVQPMYAGGMIYAPDTVWAEMVITEVSQAPKSKYDDLTDTVSQALLYLRRAGIAMLEPEVKEERLREMKYKPAYAAPYDV